MEDLFGQIEFRSKSDSIVMRILRSAMDKTHEKLQHMDGPIEFLHERTTFYELAAILVEGGLNIVQEEADVLEGTPSKILSDLMEIRQWLQGRIQDMKQLIVAKDGELMEKLANETKLQQALELKDNELRTKTDDIHDLPVSNPTVSTDKDISKLKNSVDQQVSNLKQKLEDEKKILTTERRVRRSRVSSPNLSFDFLDKERSGSLFFSNDDPFGIEKFSNMKSLSELSRLNQNVLIKGMSSDIDILKDTLDLAFGRMQSAEALPLEKQWKWAIEKDIESVMVKGFMRDLRENFDIQLKKKVGLLKDKWLDFIIEMRSLFHELKDFVIRNDADEKGISTNAFPRVRRTTSESFIDISFTETPVEDDSGSNHVAKMIKNHESIICKQRQQYKWLTKEGCSSKIKKENKGENGQERRIQDAIARLDNFTKRNHKLADKTGCSYKNRGEDRRIPSRKIKTNRSTSKAEKLEEERDGLCLQISLMEDIYRLLFQSMTKEVGNGKSSHDPRLEDSTSTQILPHYLEITVREDLYVVFFRETVKQWKETRTQTASSDVPEKSIESHLKEDIYMVFFREMDACAIESFFREDVYQFVLIEAMKDTHAHVMEAEAQRQFDYQERTPRSRRFNADNCQEGTPRSSRKLGADGDESLIQKIDCLLECLEAEEDLMLKASSMIKEHSVNNSLVILNCEETEERDAIEWLLTDDESTFGSVSDKLERALQQLYTSKELLAELEESLDGFGECEQLGNALSIEQEDDRAAQSDEVLANIMQFRRLLDNLERQWHEHLQSTCLRLEQLKCRVDTLTRPVARIRTRKFLYKKAFISRCHNLRLAEAEVDLLGDQVESLLYLLERIYAVLSRNAAVLSGYFEVYDILRLIKTELNSEKVF